MPPIISSKRPIILLLSVLLLSCGAGFQGRPIEPWIRTFYLMGTELQIHYFETDHPKAIRDMEAMVQVVEQTEAELSDWREETEISRLNRHPPGKPFPLSPSFCSVLKQTREWNRRTGGAFDPAIGSLIQVWGIRNSPTIPSDMQLKEALQTSGIQYLLLEDCIAVRKRDILLDSGGFGKGEALFRVIKMACRKRFSPFLIDFGGQIVVYGGKRWETEIADPLDRKKGSGIVLSLQSGSVATSGGSERDVQTKEMRIGHILDPTTGRPCPFFGSVTVWNENPLVADILSTALYVMGPEKGYRWAEENGIAAVFLGKNLRLATSTIQRKIIRK